MRCSVVFFLSALNRDITCAQELRELALQELRELALQELVPQVQALLLVLALLLLSLQALPVSFLVRTDSQLIQA
ncbi:MAG: hypothetical protein L7F78_10565 [Syntrophales bacterium LBB04]|nr:hypothetical protein [Syntrophales bacterium LBB04]